MNDRPRTLICRCAERCLLDPEALASAEDQASAEVVQDLCGSAAACDPLLADLAASPGTRIFACHPRAVRALFQRAGAELPDTAEIVNLRRDDNTPVAVGNPPAATGWSPWFPLIDENRCTRCGQCMEFCLFGVYEQDADGAVRVVNPRQCKNNCPACARICPEAAIMFPKLKEEPINGAEITDELELKANIKVNVDRILGDDVYAALAERGQKRRRLLDQKKMEQALRERSRWTGLKL